MSAALAAVALLALAAVLIPQSLQASSGKTITLSVTPEVAEKNGKKINGFREGDTGTKDIAVVVTLSEPAPKGFSVDVVIDIIDDRPPHTVGRALGLGTNGCNLEAVPDKPKHRQADYCFPYGGAVAFAEGATQGTQTIRIYGDTRVEPDETFYLLGHKHPWTPGRIILTIVDDDDAEGSAINPTATPDATPNNNQEGATPEPTKRPPLPVKNLAVTPSANGEAVLSWNKSALGKHGTNRCLSARPRQYRYKVVEWTPADSPKTDRTEHTNHTKTGQTTATVRGLTAGQQYAALVWSRADDCDQWSKWRRSVWTQPGG